MFAPGGAWPWLEVLRAGESVGLSVMMVRHGGSKEGVWSAEVRSGVEGAADCEVAGLGFAVGAVAEVPAAEEDAVDRWVCLGGGRRPFAGTWPSLRRTRSHWATKSMNCSSAGGLRREERSLYQRS